MERFEFRYRLLAPDGRCFVEIPASAALVGNEVCPFSDVWLNGAPIESIDPQVFGSMLDFMDKTGLIDEMRRIVSKWC